MRIRVRVIASMSCWQSTIVHEPQARILRTKAQDVFSLLGDTQEEHKTHP